MNVTNRIEELLKRTKKGCSIARILRSENYTVDSIVDALMKKGFTVARENNSLTITLTISDLPKLGAYDNTPTIPGEMGKVLFSGPQLALAA